MTRPFGAPLLALWLMGGVGTALAANDQQCFPLNAAAEAEIGFCQAVRVGDTLYISGTVGTGEMPQAIENAYQGLRQTLEARGLSFAHVVKETVYTTDLDAFIRHKDARKRFYGAHRPAASWVQVARLYQPDYRLEIELIAVYPR